jgi:hypothetical protein
MIFFGLCFHPPGRLDEVGLILGAGVGGGRGAGDSPKGLQWHPECFSEHGHLMLDLAGVFSSAKWLFHFSFTTWFRPEHL